MGVEFHDDREVERNEIRAAAAAFLGEPAPRPLWSEAFKTDPQSALKELFPVGAGLRVSVMTDRTDWAVEEALREKSHTEPLTTIFEAARTSGASFEERSELEFRAAREWQELRPLFFPVRYEERRLALWKEHLEDRQAGNDVMRTGSPFNRFLLARSQGLFIVDLIRRYPSLPERKQAFYDSQHVRTIPMLRYPSLLMAALETLPGRKAKDGDVYDLQHLTKGLSRCDTVTADGGMVQLCINHKLVPPGVSLFAARDVDALTRHLQALP